MPPRTPRAPTPPAALLLVAAPSARCAGADLSVYITGLLGTDIPLVPRQAQYASFYDAKSVVLDQGLALSFPAPNSFTGEHVLELHGQTQIFLQH